MANKGAAFAPAAMQLLLAVRDLLRRLLRDKKDFGIPIEPALKQLKRPPPSGNGGQEESAGAAEAVKDAGSAASDAVVFTEALHDGLNSAAQSLSQMAGALFLAAPPRPAHVSLPQGLLRGDPSAHGLFVSFSGDLFGSVLIVFPGPDAKTLMQSLTRACPAPGADMGQAALQETANILANAAFLGVSRNLGLFIYPQPPILVQHDCFAAGSASLLPAEGELVGPGSVWHAEILSAQMQVRVHFFLFLCADSVARLQSSAARVLPAAVEVGLGELIVADAPAILRTVCLGSCLAVIIYDATRKKGGMAHVLLSACPSADKACSHPGKYADTAVSALLDRMKPHGAALVAWLVGGAHMRAAANSPLLASGQSNTEAARERLKAAGILRVASDTGGTHCRTAELYTATGEVWVRVGYPPRKLVV